MIQPFFLEVILLCGTLSLVALVCLTLMSYDEVDARVRAACVITILAGVLLFLGGCATHTTPKRIKASDLGPQKLPGVVQIVRDRCGQVTYGFAAGVPERIKQMTRRAARYWNSELSTSMSEDPREALFVEETFNLPLIVIDVVKTTPWLGLYQYKTVYSGCPSGRISITFRAINWRDEVGENILRHEFGHGLGLPDRLHQAEGYSSMWESDQAVTMGAIARTVIAPSDHIMSFSLPTDVDRLFEASPLDLKTLWGMTEPVWNTERDTITQ